MPRARERLLKQRAYFVRNEIAHASDLSPDEHERLQDAMKSCAASARDVWQYASWHSRAAEALAPAYGLFLILIELGAPAIDEMIQHSFFRESRGRKPTKGKPALLATQFTLRPRTTDQRKLCSSWALLLKSFARRNVTSDEFEAALNRTNLRTCIHEERNDRRAERAIADAQTHSADNVVEGQDLDVDRPEWAGREDAVLFPSSLSANDCSVRDESSPSRSPTATYTLCLSLGCDKRNLGSSHCSVPEEVARTIHELIAGSTGRRLSPMLLSSVAKALSRALTSAGATPLTIATTE